MSKSFTSALLSRFAMGTLNGISGIIKRAAIQQARLSKKVGGSHDEEEWWPYREYVGQRSSTYLTQRQRAEVYTRIWEVHYDQESRTIGDKCRHLARKAIAVN
mmetsp:Transcript_28208/g.58788  ORF Transcript_28208/g.58788 Transcript_28208/m.58788 type:complete len:103 (-) Transcript_28208:346-654(-)